MTWGDVVGGLLGGLVGAGSLAVLIVGLGAYAGRRLRRRRA